MENWINIEKVVNYPIFIKPRWGHLGAGSKNCYKVKNKKEFLKYKKLKNMMWSEYLDYGEGMTDFIILNGNILYQITYKYSDNQVCSIADDWKFISSENKCPESIKNWVNKYLVGYTGACNVQYRGEKIIEVGLRLARGGAYITSTKNIKLITNNM